MPYVLQERRPALDPIVYEMSITNLAMNDIKSLLIKMCNPLLLYDIRIDPIIDLWKKADVKPNGDINYILFRYAKYYITESYNNYKNFIGALEAAAGKVTYIAFSNEYREAAAEIRRRLLGPYEDKKIEENGDV